LIVTPADPDPELTVLADRNFFQGVLLHCRYLLLDTKTLIGEVSE
jgi:hypothetical protein